MGGVAQEAMGKFVWSECTGYKGVLLIALCVTVIPDFVVIWKIFSDTLDVCPVVPL